MEKCRFIKDCFAVFLFVFLMVFAFFILQPLAYSEVKYADTARHILKLGENKVPFEVRNGRVIYLEHCAPCHGDTGKGNGKYYASSLKPKPRDFTNPGFSDRVSKEYLTEVIKKGTASVGKSPYCPPWGNTLKEDEQIENIIAFIKTLYR